MALLSLGAAVENLMLARDRRRPRVVLGRRTDLLPGGSPRRARPRRRLAPPCPRPRRPPRPRATCRRDAAARARSTELPHVPLTVSVGRVRGTSRSCAACPASSVVQGFQPRWIAARPGRARSGELARHAAGAYRAGSPNPVMRAIGRTAAARWSRRPVPMLTISPPAFSVARTNASHDVVDEDEVAGLLAVAEDRGALPGEQLRRRRSRRRRPRRADPDGARTRWRTRAPCTRGRGSPGSSGGSRPPPSWRRRTGDAGCCGWPSRVGVDSGTP